MESSTRRYFGTDGIRGLANVFPLTAEFALQIGSVAGELFLEKAGDGSGVPCVVIGRDPRESGDLLESAMAAGFASRGIRVYLAGVIPTPAVALWTRELNALCGVVISASHNPYHDNGIKFFGPDGYKLDDAIEEELERRLELPVVRNGAGPVGRIVPLREARERYVAAVCAGAGNDPSLFAGLRIALDAANGASFETSRAILEVLGAEVFSFHDQPDGVNINAQCGCTHPEVIEALVRQSGADLGISHDGDADRMLLCDEEGSVLDGDEIMAVSAVAMINEGTLRENTLVATVMSNAGLDEVLKQAGGRLVRAAVGDRHVIARMREGNFSLGGEQSGHFIFHQQGTTGDGIVAAVQVLRLMRASGQRLADLRRVLTKFPQAQRKVRVREKRSLEQLHAFDRIGEIEKTLGSAGRVLVRYSGTEPLLRILIEGRDASWIESEADALAALIAAEIGG
jgi:phosphoglucosamine mutase